MRAKAQEGERGDVQDGAGDPQRADHDQGGEGVGQDAAQQDAAGRFAERPGGDHEVALLDREDRGTHDAGVDRDPHDADGEGGVQEPRAEHRDHGDRQDQRREGKQHVHEPHDQVVEPAPGVARDRPEHGADEDREADRRDPDQQRDAGAEDDSAVLVATVAIDPQEVLRTRGRAAEEVDAGAQLAGRDQPLLDAGGGVGVMGGDHGSRDRDRQQDAEQQEADLRHALARDVAPRVGPEADRVGGQVLLDLADDLLRGAQRSVTGVGSAGRGMRS